jgi:hypothetical protein
MNRLAASAVFAIFTAGTAMAGVIPGSWTATVREAGKVHVNIQRDHSNNSHTYNISEFNGLSEAQMRAGTPTPIVFTLQREAGTIAFDGTFKGGNGGGQFMFTSNPAYLDKLRAMDVKVETRGRRGEDDIDETMLSLATLDVSTDYIRSLKAEGYNEDLDEYIAMRIFKVTPALIREFRTLGIDKLDADDLVASQVHKVTPEYVREMRAAGRTNMTMDDLVASRIHKATPEFYAQMKEIGYELDQDDAVAFRIHRVTPEFIRELRDLGYTNISADNLVAMRIHRVTPQFIRELRDAGYTNVPVDKLIAMRVHNIDVNFVKKMNGKQ